MTQQNGDNALTYIEATTAPEPDACVIWLHGLGADAHDFAGVIPELGLWPSAAVRFLFPNAPPRPVTINNGMVMRAWYDIYNERFTETEDQRGIEASTRLITGLINQQIDEGIDSRRIVVAGFSQGGAIALHCGLHQDRPLAGIIALSTYIPLAKRLPMAGDAPPPILMLHGRDDGVVPLSLAQQSCRLLQDAGYRTDWQVYPIAHSVSDVELQDIGRWLGGVLQKA